MTDGLRIFRERLGQYKNDYVLIGGMACFLHFENADLDFRATKDLDIVLLTDSTGKEFLTELWDFFACGEYVNKYRSNKSPQYYRFEKPKNEDYPAIIELFSKKSDIFDSRQFGKINVSESLPSLSAILLDTEYYNVLRTGKSEVQGLQVLDVISLIPFKMKAFLDLSEKKRQNGFIDSKDIKKHKNDVFRLVALLTGKEHLPLPESIKNDVVEFLSIINNEPFEVKGRVSKEEMIKTLRNIYLGGNAAAGIFG